MPAEIKALTSGQPGKKREGGKSWLSVSPGRGLGALSTLRAVNAMSAMSAVRTMPPSPVNPQHAFERSEFFQGGRGQSAFRGRQLLGQCGCHFGRHAGLRQGIDLTQAVATTDHDHPLAMALLQQRSAAARILQPTGQGPVSLYHHRGNFQRRLGLVKLLFHDPHNRLRIVGWVCSNRLVVVGRVHRCCPGQQAEQDQQEGREFEVVFHV